MRPEERKQYLEYRIAFIISDFQKSVIRRRPLRGHMFVENRINGERVTPAGVIPFTLVKFLKTFESSGFTETAENREAIARQGGSYFCEFSCFSVLVAFFYGVKRARRLEKTRLCPPKIYCWRARPD